MKITPDNITTLKDNQVFVFGSNSTGFHGAGGAGLAFRGTSDFKWRQDPFFLKAMKSKKDSKERIGNWAIFGISRGFQEGHNGKSYAIETIKKAGNKRSIPLTEIENQIIELFDFANNNPQYEFLITKFGSSLAGYTVLEIKKLFLNKTIPNNISLPKEYIPKYYAGIGSRETPKHILKKMTEIGLFLSEHGYILRSGGAKGADQAFELKALYKDIYYSQDATKEAKELCLQYHPNPEAIKKNNYVLGLMGRNMQILLGKNLMEPVDFVICWTKNGAISGGTGQAIRYCIDHNITIYNLGNKEDIQNLINFIDNLEP